MANTKKYAANGLAVGIAAAALSFAAPASAFTVDGILTTADEYNCALCYKYTVDYKITNVGHTSYFEKHDGMVKIGRDVGTGNASDTSTYNGDVYMLVVAPLAIVDNVYKETGTPQGWTQTIYGQTFNIGHTFNNLEIQDALEFKVEGNLTRVGYLDGTTDRAEIESDAGNVIVDVATSLEYNLNAGHGDHWNSPDPSNNPPAGWVQEVVYEYQLAGGTFADGMVGIASFSESWFNAYSNKRKGDSWMDMWCMYDPGDSSDCNPMHMPGDPPTAMSEPASGAVFLAGLGLMSLYRRRRAVK